MDADKRGLNRPGDEMGIRVSPRESVASVLSHSSPAGPLYRREDLAPAATIPGPAVIGEYSGTTWVPTGWCARRLECGALLHERSEAHA